MTRLVLASQSASRQAMLEAAGVPFTVVPARVDEGALKDSLRAAGIDGRGLADALAEMKAVKVSHADPDALVLGCDSTVTAADGSPIDKAESRAAVAAQLARLSGTTHRLTSAVVASERGLPVWRHVATAKLTMRTLSADFIEAYLDREWPEVGACVGGYRLEGPGVQLFSRIEGDHFTILGLPLLPLLGWLRDRGVMPA